MANNTANFRVSVMVGSSETTIEGVVFTDREWQHLTDSQIKEKTNKAYQNALKSVLDARREVTPT